MAKRFKFAFGFPKGFPRLGELPKDLQRLNENWHTLPRRAQEAILILGRVRPISRASTPASPRRPKRGEMPEWLITALNILKDAKGYMPDSEIARRVGVNQSTLCRNETYVNAKRSYLQPYLTIGKSGLPHDTKS